MTEEASKKSTLVDPDPYTIAQTFFGAAAFVVQLLSMRNSTPPPPNSFQLSENLLHLETALGSFQLKSRKIVRTLERGVHDVDRNFYDRPYRVGTSPMMMDMASHQQFRTDLLELTTVAGQLGIWINTIIANEPVLAARLGERLHQDLGGIVDRLNDIMQKGLPNREAIQAERETIDALASAIEAELRGQN